MSDTVLFQCYQAIGDTGTCTRAGQPYWEDGEIGWDRGHGVSGVVELNMGSGGQGPVPSGPEAQVTI